jgi:hypothetical protein
MRLLAALLTSSIALGTTAVAGGPPSAPPSSAAKALRAALNSMMTPPGQSERPVDRDQGDDHASLVAISQVCSHDNPSATRSAICPTPISPF